MKLARLGRLAVTASLLGAWLTGSALGQDADLTLLHINDVYEIEPVAGAGGFAPLMTLLKQQRGRAAHSLTTVGGDFLSPSLLSGLTRGAQMVELLNAVGVDLVGFGNHEFDFGPEITRQRIAESHFPWLGTNVLDDAGEPFGGALATAVREVGEVRIGFFGLLTPETAMVSSPGTAVHFSDPVTAARQAVTELRAAGVHAVIALTHLDFAADRALARQVPGIDVILGGHDHDPVSLYENGTLIVKAGHDARFLGVVDLEIRTASTAAGPKTTVSPHAWHLLANSGLSPDPEVLARLAPYRNRLDAEMATVIGTLAAPLDSRRATMRAGEAAIGDLFADTLRRALGTDVVLLNGGAFRGDQVRPAGGQFTRGDVLAELPFGNLAVVVALSGADLRAALENGVGSVETRAGRFPQVSGLRFSYDPAAPPGHRLRSVTVGGRPLDEAATYRVGTSDYLLGGGDGYDALGRGEVVVDASAAVLIATLVMDALSGHGTLTAGLDGRIAAVP
ncbi:MAG: bifunctional metallophosphatase/5'-nucleotidase [Azospirillum sp.]|nr:bifunctional metallophosphatase/5'-nucleotidase [Azospirillum sp.]